MAVFSEISPIQRTGRSVIEVDHQHFLKVTSITTVSNFSTEQFGETNTRQDSNWIHLFVRATREAGCCILSFREKNNAMTDADGVKSSSRGWRVIVNKRGQCLERRTEHREPIMAASKHKMAFSNVRFHLWNCPNLMKI
jgi:hypothetical protein